jgi:hypothetical protein
MYADCQLDLTRGCQNTQRQHCCYWDVDTVATQTAAVNVVILVDYFLLLLLWLINKVNIL